MSSLLHKIKKKLTIKNVLKVAVGVGAAVATGGISAGVAAGVGSAVAAATKKPAPTAANGGGAVSVGGVLRDLGGAVVHAGQDLVKAETGRVTNAVRDALSAAKKDVSDLAQSVATGGAAAAARVDSVPTGTPAGLGPSTGVLIVAGIIGVTFFLARKK